VTAALENCNIAGKPALPAGVGFGTRMDARRAAALVERAGVTGDIARNPAEASAGVCDAPSIAGEIDHVDQAAGQTAGAGMRVRAGVADHAARRAFAGNRGAVPVMSLSRHPGSRPIQGAACGGIDRAEEEL